MLAHAYKIIIDSSVGSTGHGREVVDDLNDTEKFAFNVNGKCETAWCSSL